MRHKTAFLLVLSGVLLIELAWSLVVPPFRGLDEHDHAYRADSVASGAWRPDGRPAENGGGGLVPVRSTVVEAAKPVCEYLPYPGPDNCRAVATTSDPDRVLVASSAFNYNPVFYGVVGSAALPFDGVTALLAMRAAAGLICAVLIALAFLLCRVHFAGPWMAAGMAIVLTPTTTYSLMVAAPNGLELAAAVLAWVALLAIANKIRGSDYVPVHLFALAVMGLATIATLRSIGPLWVTVIVLITAVHVPAQKLRSAVVSRPGAYLVSTGVVVTACLGGIGWTLTSGTNDPGDGGGGGSDAPWSKLFGFLIVWVMQIVGVFPTRNEFAPVMVYVLALAAGGLLVLVGVRYAARRLRLAMALVLLGSICIPAGLTLITYEELGYVWQGRYGWPLSMGLPLVAGWALAASPRSPPVLLRLLPLVCFACVAGATAIGQVAVLQNELRKIPGEYDPDWTAPHAFVVAALTFVGFGLLVFVMRAERPRLPSPVPKQRSAWPTRLG